MEKQRYSWMNQQLGLSDISAEAKALALSVLWRSSSALEAVLLAFFDARIPGNEAVLLEDGPEIRIGKEQCASNTVPQGTSLAGNTATVKLGNHAEFTLIIGHFHWLENGGLPCRPWKSVLQRFVIYQELTAACV